MDCYTYREALSARLDGEPAPVAEEQVGHHLAACAACRTWQQRATALTRQLRVRPARPTPDLTDAVLSAAAHLPRRRPRWLPRVLLGCVAVCQLALGVAQTFGFSGGGHHGTGVSMTGHLFNESTAWNLALGLGMLWTVWRARASSGLVPVLATFLLVLTGFSISDFLNGAVTRDRLATHLLLVLGLLLLLVIQRDHTRRQPDPSRTAAFADAPRTPPADTATEDTPPNRDTDHRHLGPAGYRRAG